MRGAFITLLLVFEQLVLLYFFAIGRLLCSFPEYDSRKDCGLSAHSAWTDQRRLTDRPRGAALSAEWMPRQDHVVPLRPGRDHRDRHGAD